MERVKEKERIENQLNMLDALSNPKTIEGMINGLDEAAATMLLEELTALREETTKEVSNALPIKDTKRAWGNTNPLITSLFGNKHGIKPKEIYLGTSKETGEKALFSLLQGYITPYENEIIECVTKFRLDGQVTKDGKIYFTLGQLYRAMRHGAGTTNLNKKMKEELAADLEALRRDITFELNEPLKLWGNFTATGGTYPILQFAKAFGYKANGNDIDTMYIVSNDLNIVNDISERLHMGETFSQEIKSIKKGGKRWQMGKKQIAMRNYLWNRVLSYIRARRNEKNFSPCIPYSQIFDLCGIGAQSIQKQRAKADIATILNYWQEIGIISSWSEYINANSTKPSGIQIRVEKELVEGVE